LSKREERGTRRGELVSDGSDLCRQRESLVCLGGANLQMSDVTIGHKLSFAQPKPTTMKSCHWYHPIPIS
jgi:hypothetical protein